MCELKLTNVNTIVSSDGSFKELIIDDFFDILNKKHGSDYAIYYEADENKFIVIFNGFEYYLTLDKITMENYLIGKDNNFTLKLRSIINKTEKMKKSIADEEEQEALMALEKEKYEEEMDRRRKIIEDAEQGIIPDNDEAKKIYLDYLLDEKRLPNRVMRYFKNLGSDFYSIGSNSLLFMPELFVVLFDLFIMLFIGGSFYGIISGFIGKEFLTLGELFWKYFKISLLPFKTYKFIFFGFSFRVIGKRISRLLHYGENKRLIEHKIEELTHSLSLNNVKDRAIESFDETLKPEENVEYSISIDDYVMGYLGDIVARLKYINPVDSEKLLSEVEELATEYKQRLEKIRTKELKDDHTEINLVIDQETENSIKVDILIKASYICNRMLQIRGYDVEKMKLDDDFTTLMSMINEPAEKIVGGERSRVRKPTDNINKIND